MSDQDPIAQDQEQKTFLNQQDNQQVKADDLVGEGKKFKDVDALAAGKGYADQFIEQLKTENAAKDVEIERLRSQGSVIEDLKSELTNLSSKPNLQEEDTKPSGENVNLNEVDFETRVKAVLAGDKQQENINKNLNIVDQRLAEKYGKDNVGKVGETLAASLGVSIGFLNDVAAKSPEAFMKLLEDGDTSKSSSSAAISSTVNTEGAVLNNTQEGTYSWYKAKRKEMGDTKYYLDTRLQAEIHEKAAEYGEGFFKT